MVFSRRERGGSFFYQVIELRLRKSIHKNSFNPFLYDLFVSYPRSSQPVNIASHLSKKKDPFHSPSPSKNFFFYFYCFFFHITQPPKSGQKKNIIHLLPFFFLPCWPPPQSLYPNFHLQDGTLKQRQRKYTAG